MKLRYSTTSPFVRKVSATIIECGLEDKVERIPTKVTPTTRNDGMALDNPLVKIPALITDDEITLYDSPVICEYLDSISGGKMFPTAGKARWIALRQQALGDGILDAGVLTRYESLRPKEFQWPEWIDGQLRKMRGALSSLESECANGALTDVADGGVPTIGQLTIGCALGYLDFRYDSEKWRDDHQRLAAWYERFAKRLSMTETEPKDL